MMKKCDKFVFLQISAVFETYQKVFIKKHERVPKRPRTIARLELPCFQLSIWTSLPDQITEMQPATDK